MKNKWDKFDYILIGLVIGFLVGAFSIVFVMKTIYIDSIERWNEVTYKYSYCPYCGEELGIGFDDK